LNPIKATENNKFALSTRTTRSPCAIRQFLLGNPHLPWPKFAGKPNLAWKSVHG